MKLLIVIGLLVIFGILYFFLQGKGTLAEIDNVSTDVQPAVKTPDTDSDSETESIMERKEVLDNTAESVEGFLASASNGGGSASNGGGSASNGGGSASGSDVGPYNPSSDEQATLQDLKGMIPKIEAEITRLQADGNIDEIIRRRKENLLQIKDRINEIITQVENKSIAEIDIRIMKSQVDEFLIALNNKSPLPDIMAGGQLDSYLKSILPSNLENDREVAETISKYIKSMATNLSWQFGFKYTSDAEKIAAERYNRRAGQAPEGESDFFADNYNKASTSYDHQPDYHLDNRQTTDEFANMPHEACRGPAHFDWKRRSTEICRAIKGRGLNPEDYGCMPEKTEVGSDFSYRGYANMICTRVAANYDTGLGSLVGCPPLDWPGWRLP